MRHQNAEIMKNTRNEVNLSDMLENARQQVANVEFEANRAEEDARSLELELMQAQAAHERKEEAERQGKETNEKIAELGG